jgi:hypothetical protein
MKRIETRVLESDVLPLRLNVAALFELQNNNNPLTATSRRRLERVIMGRILNELDLAKRFADHTRAIKSQFKYV